MVDKSRQTANKDRMVAYFDFDGTITTKDTLIPFLITVAGWVKFIVKLPRLLPILLLYGVKFITNEQAKEKTLTILLKGVRQSKIEKRSATFALKKIDKYINPSMYSKLEYHLEHGHYVVIVSANLAVYLSIWGEKHNVNQVIATEVEFVNGRCTGRLLTRNCYGMQKLLRIKEFLENANQEFDYSYGYGNSRGDYELLSFVNEGYFITKSDEIIPWTEYTHCL